MVTDSAFRCGPFVELESIDSLTLFSAWWPGTARRTSGRTGIRISNYLDDRIAVVIA